LIRPSRLRSQPLHPSKLHQNMSKVKSTVAVKVQPELTRTDFAKAFTAGHVFQLPDRAVTVKVAKVATLVTTSGSILAAEPLLMSSAHYNLPFRRKIAPGRYPVEISFADHNGYLTPAAMKLKIKATKPVTWEMATCQGQDLKKLRAGQIYGYPTDGATGAFVDAKEINQYIKKIGTAWNEVVNYDFYVSVSRQRYAEVVINRKTGANLVACLSGEGDGCYASYWGFDKQGEVACLVTDFTVFIESRNYQVVIPNIATLVGTKPLEHEVFEKLNMEVRLRRSKDKRHKMQLENSGGSCMEAKLITSTGKVLGDTSRSYCSEIRHDEERISIHYFKTSSEKWPADAALHLKFSCGVRAF